MKLLVGLGNPGQKYETTRHNAGFLLLDLLADSHGISWESSKKFDALIGQGSVLGEKVILLKPQTYMNLSGRSVIPCLSFYKVPLSSMVVIHDDVDVPFGKVKARIGGGHGGHNGIRNIIELSGSANFSRIKLGIGKPDQKNDSSRPAQDVKDWVLDPFTDSELESVEKEMYKEALIRLKGIFDGSSDRQ